MAKVSFSKLDIKINLDTKKIKYKNSKGEEYDIEVISYLPIEEKLSLITNVINKSIDENGFYNPIKVKIFTVLEIMDAYTNLNITPKQKENPLKLYDSFMNSGIFKQVIDSVFEDDWKEIQEFIQITIENIYKYKNSVMGILDTIVDDYNNLNLEASEIQEKLSNPENLTLLKDILTKLG